MYTVSSKGEVTLVGLSFLFKLSRMSAIILCCYYWKSDLDYCTIISTHGMNFILKKHTIIAMIERLCVLTFCVKLYYDNNFILVLWLLLLGFGLKIVMVLTSTTLKSYNECPFPLLTILF